MSTVPSPAASTFNTIRLDPRNAYLFSNVQVATLADYKNPFLRHKWVHTDWPLYVAVSRGDDAAMILFQNRPGFVAEVLRYLDTDPDYVRVFANTDVVVYRWKDGPTVAPPSDAEATGQYASSRASPPPLLLLLCASALSRPSSRRLLSLHAPGRGCEESLLRLRLPVAAFSIAVIAVAGYWIAELIGYVR